MHHRLLSWFGTRGGVKLMLLALAPPRII